MRINDLWTYPDTEPPGLSPWVSTALVVGPFEEEKKVCDVSKMEGEVPATTSAVRGDLKFWPV